MKGDYDEPTRKHKAGAAMLWEFQDWRYPVGVKNSIRLKFPWRVAWKSIAFDFQEASCFPFSLFSFAWSSIYLSPRHGCWCKFPFTRRHLRYWSAITGRSELSSCIQTALSYLPSMESVTLRGIYQLSSLRQSWAGRDNWSSAFGHSKERGELADRP